ncbi:hypothetical protein B9T10_03680 [Wohlfahrtiimonas chitiniclastica]|uniref:hypothetical protein n=1 Tax=Wohlfahrtiimonas chitiniclastica TaxID=400946 RepID=UPI000B98B7BF|nr:hypothetical protein [Wohlfahrtiimonas chitiniclastica]OYQ90432.1 hypothetical protein B9T10_03680 [Wohlfahrtiimonas chitiniclastica]
MKKIKNIFIAALGVIIAFLYIVLQSKNRKIQQQDLEIKQHKSKNEELTFINNKEQESKNDQDKINITSEHDIDSMLEQSKAYRD